jgi:leucyl aminopeptidase
MINNIHNISKTYDTYIIFFCSDIDNTIKNTEKLLKIKVPSFIKKEFSGKRGEISSFNIDDSQYLLVGFNNNKCVDNYAFEVSSIIGKQIYNTKKKYLIILNDFINSHISGIMQGLYKFTKYNNKKIYESHIDFYTNINSKYNINNIIKLNEIQYDIRDLVNEPVNILDSMEYLKRIRRSLSKYKNIKIKVLNEDKLKKLGLNLILSVNKGSDKPALLVVIEYINNKKDDNICLVGKGVMFDTGGINIKTKNFYDMKIDMTGSAIVYGTIKALAELNVKKNIIGILPLVQNDIGSSATHPGDIIKSYSGKTVEILDTDAEGRLILADGISYCKKYNPKMIIDIATLTGHISNVFGDLATGIFGNDHNLNQQIIQCGLNENEKLWELPVWDEYREMTKSTIADLKNISFNPAGSATAAAFLQEFLPNSLIKWVHLDIAGVSYNLSDNKTKYEGATGEIFRTLVNYLSYDK